MLYRDLRGAGRRDENQQQFTHRASRRGLLAAVVLTCALPSAPALADEASADIVSTNVPTIIVENNGSEYTHVTNSSQSITGEIQVKIDAEVTGRVESFEAYPMLGSLYDFHSASWDYFKDAGYSKSYSVPRPKSVTENFNFEIPRQDYADFMVAVCNIHADKLRSQGKKNSEIFSKNRTVAFAVEGQVDAELTGPDRINPPPTEVSQLYTLSVTCKRDDALDPVAAPQVEGAYMQAKAGPKNLRGTCELELNGSVITRDPNTEVKFVYVDDKGNVSDLKTVTTSGEANTTFQHKFPISAQHKSGKIRMVGQSHPFYSNWASFETQCSEPVDDIKTVLPPKAVAVEAYATADNVMHRGRICPAKAKIWGVLEGRGDVSGAVAFFADGKLKALRQYEAEDGKTIILQAEHDLSWEGNQTGQQSVHYLMNVSNGVGDLVDHVEKSWSFECKKPEVNAQFDNAPGGIASNDNLPKSVTLSLSTLGQKKLPGWICPEKVRLHGNVMSDDQPLSGTAVLYVGDTFIKEHDVELEANWGHNYDADYELSWNAATQTEQTLEFTLKFANEHNYVVKTVKKSEDFACQKVSTTGIAGAGGLTGGEKPSQSSQQVATGVLVQPQALQLAIMAPKGTVRKGEIRLSGGKPTTTYKLTFFRKSGGKATQVSSAQLPKQMKGANASFPLAALTGGRSWRLQVCPLGQGPAACETSDFRIPLIGAKQDKTAPTQPKATIVIVPGALN